MNQEKIEKKTKKKSSTSREQKKEKKKTTKDNVTAMVDDKANESDSDCSIPGLIELPDGTEEWIIEKVIGRKVVRGLVYYRVKWQGWTHKYNTWEPAEHLKNSKDAVRDFQKKLALELKGGKKPAILPSAIQEEINEQVEGQVVVKREVTDEEKANGDSVDGSAQAAVDELAEKFRSLADDDDEMDTDAEEVHVIESEEDNEENDPKFIRREKLKWGPAYSMVRHVWKSDEIALCVLGSTYYVNVLYHLVRIKTDDEDAQDIFNDPYSGVSATNVVIVASDVLRKAHPQILINYYEKRSSPLENAKSEQELAMDAARNNMHSYFKRIGYETNYNRMLEDNMPPDQRISEEQLRKYDNRFVSNKKANEEEDDEQCMYPKDEAGRIMYEKPKDDFGLPFYYGSEVEKDEDYVTDSDSDVEAERFKELGEVQPLKVPRVKNRPQYKKVWTRPCPNVPGIDREVYRRVKE